jgi:hypothetical protein
MAETAVGLFEDSETASLVVDALRAEGFPAQAMRVVAQPAGTSVQSATGTPGLDFRAGLGNDLRSMGATEEECAIYLAGVASGKVLVFVTGTEGEIDRVLRLMEEHEPFETEAFANAEPMLPGIHVAESETGIALKEDRARTKISGARVFSW